MVFNFVLSEHAQPEVESKPKPCHREELLFLCFVEGKKPLQKHGRVKLEEILGEHIAQVTFLLEKKATQIGAIVKLNK